MKKKICFVWVLWCAMLLSCSGLESQPENDGNENEVGSNGGETMTESNDSDVSSDHGEGEFLGVSERFGGDLNDMVGAKTDFFVDEHLALEIGDAVLESAYGDKVFDNTKYLLYEVANKGFYIFVRMSKDNIPGMDYNVAIGKKNGEILKIWVGE